MAQPTTALLCPEPDDDRPMPACPDFCDGTCADWRDREEHGDAHHTSDFKIVALTESPAAGPIDWYVSASRTDADFEVGTCDVNLLPSRCDGATMTPAEARQLAALLLNAADMADPMPFGVLPALAADLRLGDELLTDDGWQAITGLMFFKDSDQASAYTPQRDEGSDGWQFGLTDPVRIRRRIHGSPAIAFTEPVR